MLASCSIFLELLQGQYCPKGLDLWQGFILNSIEVVAQGEVFLYNNHHQHFANLTPSSVGFHSSKKQKKSPSSLCGFHFVASNTFMKGRGLEHLSFLAYICGTSPLENLFVYLQLQRKVRQLSLLFLLKPSIKIKKLNLFPFCFFREI